MSSAKVLIVEDEENVLNTLTERLQQEGYQLFSAGTVTSAKQAITDSNPDLVLMDVTLPDGTGFDVATFLREKRPESALIFLTAHSNPEERIKGLELGAEDYVTKPFHLKELLLRIQNVLRRAKNIAHSSTEVILIGEAQVFLNKFIAIRDGIEHRLTHKECALIKLFLEKKGTVVSRDIILDQVWSLDEFPSPRTVDNFIVRLRRLIEKKPEDPRFLISIRGVGYQLNMENQNE